MPDQQRTGLCRYCGAVLPEKQQDDQHRRRKGRNQEFCSTEHRQAYHREQRVRRALRIKADRLNQLTRKCQQRFTDNVLRSIYLAYQSGGIEFAELCWNTILVAVDEERELWKKGYE